MIAPLAATAPSLRVLRWDNAFVRALPGDPMPDNEPRQVRGAAWSRVVPTSVAAPRVVAYAREVAALLGIAERDVASSEFASVFGGNALLDGMQPYAANYGGHQFGHWAGQLGDGRAITLGETVDALGGCQELQLKGAGPTPYARHADGRAVLRSSIREFVCSEAMHHLGIPTTRALCVVATGDAVVRDMFYDGHPRQEPGAITCRVAPSFIRFGTFELPASRGDIDLLRRLADFTIRCDFPHLAPGAGDAPDETTYAAWFAEICERTARMVAEWMRVGFVHGVMNTDNMSILGMTIDYGPYGWIDAFDPDWTPNTTDAKGRRYRFGQQPRIAGWNLGRLAGALAPLFATHDALQAGMQRYADVFDATDRANTARKLGLRTCGDDDLALMRELQALLRSAEVDMTLWFRGLAQVDPAAPSLAPVREAFYDEAKLHDATPAFDDWLARHAARVLRDGPPGVARRETMDAANPWVVPRNWLAQEAIDRAERGDDAGVAELLDVVRTPYAPQCGRERYAQRRPEWARDRAGCSMLSCSS